MDDTVTESDRRGMDRDRLDARIEELERQQERTRERLKTLRARRVRLTDADPDATEGPREVLLGHLERLTDADEDPEGIPEDRLTAQAVNEGVSPGDAQAALDELKRQGEVYVVDEEVRRT